LLDFVVLVVDPDLFSLNAADVKLDVVLVSAAFIAIFGIGAWIGFTKATTTLPNQSKKSRQKRKQKINPRH